MKFKRLLAAILGALMITSCMSFVASAEEAETEADIEAIEEVVVDEVEEEAGLSEETTEGETTASYTVTLNKLNGDCVIAWNATDGVHTQTNNTVATATVTAGDSYTIPEVTRTRAVLKGWATAAGGEVVHQPGATFVPEADTELFAVWERGTLKDTALVAFNAKTSSASGNGLSATKYYDAVNDIVFYRYTNTSLTSGTAQFNGGGKYHTPIGIPVDGEVGTIFFKSGVRTSVATGSKPGLNVYQVWNADGKVGTSQSFAATEPVSETGKWVTTVGSRKVYEGFEGAQQFVYYFVGSGKMLELNNPESYFDMAAFSLFETETGYNEYDPFAAASSGVNITFDLNYADAPELTAAPTEDPAREGYEFNGWSTNKDAVIGDISDLTCIAAIPTADTTYYAIWKSVSADVEVTVSYDTHGGSTVEAETYTYNPTKESYVTLPVAPTKENYTFKGWATSAHGEVLDPENVLVPEYDTTYYAVWEMTSPAEAGDTLYVSTTLGCDGCNNGFSATYPVKTFAKAQTILKANEGITNVVVIGTFTTSKDGEEFGIAGREITVSGYDSNAIFDYDAQKDGGDDDLQIKGPVVFKNITIIDGSGDGMMWANGQHVTFGEGISPNKAVEIAANGGSAVIDITSGSYGRILPGIVSNGTKEGNVTVNISGATVATVGIGHGWRGNTNFYGTYRVNVNGGTVNEITVNTNGAESANGYKGLRYYTINDGNVKSIVTTEGSQYKDNSNPQRTLTVPARTGVTVFEINKKGTVTGKIARGANVVTGAIEDDDATRIVIFNNDSYEEGKVTDPNAIVIAATNGTIHADVTVNADYTTKLNGYRYTTDATNEYIYINGTNYLLSEFANTGDEANLSEEVTVLIPADLFTAKSDNVAIFSEAPLYTVTWKNGDETVKTELVAEGTVPTAPVLEEYGKTLTWDPAVTEVTGDATYTAVWTEATVAVPLVARTAKNGLWGWANSTGGTLTRASLVDEFIEKWYLRFVPTATNPRLASVEDLTNTVKTENGKVYVAMDVRTNLAVSPTIQVSAYTVADGSTSTGTKSFGSLVPTSGNGAWERVVIEVGANAETPANGIDGLTGIKTAALYIYFGNVIADGYMDIAGVAFFTDKYSADNFVFDTTPTSATNFSIDGVISEKAPAEEPSKDNYTFKGWSKSEEGTDLVAHSTLNALPHEAATYYAIFEANTYTITFVDGEDTYEVPTKYGETPVAPVLTKTGHTLDWNKEIVAATEATTYTAVWTANNYTVTYKVDGEVNGEVETYAYGADVTMREAPTKTGYTFGGWDKTLTTMPAENVEINGTFTANNYTVTYKVDGEVYGEVETYAYGAAITMREAPKKTGYTFSGWDKTLTTMPAENVEINGTFTEDAEPFPTSATYKTYGKYDVLNDTYIVEVKFAGAKVNQGSFGFKFPTSYMTFKNVTANTAAGIEFLGNISPIYASGEGYYADTWAVTNMANAGNIDATNEEVLIATFTFGMTKDQRTAFEAALADENYKFEEYVVENADAKYHNGTYYLATPYSTGFDTTKAPITYASHTDTETAPEITYTTYGKYDEYNGTYSIDIKVKGSKINLGAFGLAFNADHMTFDPEAENAVVLAENIANYLGITLHNAADGYAFAFDGSSTADGYIDASTEEVLLATINLTMTPEQRAAFEAAGKTMNILVPTANETVDAETLAKYFDGENYLVSIYVAGLATPKLPAEYIKHNDEAIEATVADVNVEVTFASKNGATVANIAQIKLDNGEAVALEAAGNEEATLTYSFKELTIGKTYTVTVEKNGYLAGVAEITVVKGENTIEMTLIAGDIKGAEADACGDGKVDLSDFVRLIRAFDTDAGDDFIATVDIDESGAVNVADLAIIKANFNNTSADNTITINGVTNNEEAAG